MIDRQVDRLIQLNCDRLDTFSILDRLDILDGLDRLDRDGSNKSSISDTGKSGKPTLQWKLDHFYTSSDLVGWPLH